MIGFANWEYYSQVEVDNAILDLPIEYCEEVAQVITLN